MIVRSIFVSAACDAPYMRPICTRKDGLHVTHYVPRAHWMVDKTERKEILVNFSLSQLHISSSRVSHFLKHGVDTAAEEHYDKHYKHE